MSQLTRTTLGALTILLVGASAFAQNARPGRPYRGLFAGGESDAAQSLVVNASAGAGWDSSAVADVGASEPGSGVAEVAPLQSAGFGLLSGGLTYSATGQRFQLGLSTATNARYYRRLSDPVIVSHAGSLGLGFRLNPSTQLTADYSISYQPFASLNLYPGLIAPSSDGLGSIPSAIAPDPDQRGQSSEYWTYRTDAGITHRLSRQSEVSASYSYYMTDFTASSGNYHSQSAAGRFNRGLTQNLSLRLGYGFTESRPAQSLKTYQNHNIDSGIDYNRALSLSRRTTLGFRTGATAIKEGTTTRYNVIGGAHVGHEIGRTWLASAAYSRNFQFVETLNQPLLSDAITAEVSGLLSRRLQVDAGTAASNGTLGAIDSGNRLWTYSSTANLTIGVTRYLALDAGYRFYHYSTEGAALLLQGFDSRLDRHSVRVTANLWAPIFQKGRRTNASR